MTGLVTSAGLRNRKGRGSVVMLTAYDVPTARIADSAGADVILVGDSVAMVVLGHADTLAATMTTMIHHTAAVARARPRALVVADMPWMSYHRGIPDALDNAAALVRAGAQGVKVEGGRERMEVIRALVGAGIPVMGHVGLTPQSQHRLGGYRVQGRDASGAAGVLDAARGVEEAGCFALVVECVPRQVGRSLTNAAGIPVIGIGAGPDCDGQVLVIHDLLGLGDVDRGGGADRVSAAAEPGEGDRPGEVDRPDEVDRPGEVDRPDGADRPGGAGSPGRPGAPRFVRRYASLGADAREAAARFVADVRSGRFPSDAESYH
ncbi:MAG: 3-methyl-2-oxobutanoate hydroxymethyltransferase [Acidimicrobiales bacterium]